MTEKQRAQRVLVVDDERLIANSLAQILTASGFEAKAVYSGETAVTVARELRPDVLITDVMMEGISGIEAASSITQFLPACRIILFSGQAATTDLLENAEAEGQHFELLSKPVHPKVLLRHLAQIH